MKSLQIYEKSKVRIKVSNKFIYHSEIYQIWSNGAALVEDKYYFSNKLVNIKNIIVRKKGFILQRFITLEYAPEEYLVNNGFKKDETSS